jgi:hypothetical protein
MRNIKKEMGIIIGLIIREIETTVLMAVIYHIMTHTAILVRSHTAKSIKK